MRSYLKFKLGLKFGVSFKMAKTSCLMLIISIILTGNTFSLFFYRIAKMKRSIRNASSFSRIMMMALRDTSPRQRVSRDQVEAPSILSPAIFNTAFFSDCNIQRIVRFLCCTLSLSLSLPLPFQPLIFSQ